MLSRTRKLTSEKDQGFTLIELLVVMIIIGILAAIAIPVFLSQRAKARDTSTKADVSTVGKEIASYFVEPTPAAALGITQSAVGADVVVVDGATPVATIKVSNGTKLTADISYTDSTKKDSTWCVGVENANGKQVTYRYSAAAGLEKGSC